VVDSERSEDDLQPLDIERAAGIADKAGGPAIVPTVPVRRRDSPRLLEEYLRSLGSREMAGLCIVAGNPAYLSSGEASERPGKSLWRACRLAVEAMDKRPVLLGTEGVEGVSTRICAALGVTPFLLLDLGAEDEAEAFSAAARRSVAVYAPFYIGDGLPEPAISVLISYASRRRRLRSSVSGVLGVGEALRVSLVGDVGRVAERVAVLASRGVGILVGYPAVLTWEQVKQFARLAL
jgi:hypothetical protein